MRWTDWKAIALRVWDNIGYHYIYLIAAGVAFFGVLALIPAIGAVVAIYGLMANTQDILAQLKAVQSLLPTNAYELIRSQLSNLTSGQSQTLGFALVVTMVFALWSARTGVGAMVDGINVAYSERNERGLLAYYLLTLGLTAVLLVVVVVALLAIVVVPALLGTMDLASQTKWIASAVRWPILLVTSVLGIGVLYRYGPQRARARTRWISWGSMLATALWLLGSYVFSWYVSNFADYNATYGSLGAIVGLMMWFYISAYAVLFGAELDAEMEHQTAQDTTVGGDRPRGKRGAFVADHLPGEREGKRAPKRID